MDATQQIYLNQLALMVEDDLTRDIIKPLFQAMGYERVDFNGGAYEKGIDLIAIKDIPPNSHHVCYIQAKKIGPKQNAKSWEAFSQILYQLRNCASQPLKDSGGEEYRSDQIFLVCPEQAKSRFLENVGSQLYNIPPKVEFIDGVELLKLIKKFKPELLNIISNLEIDIKNCDNKDLVNSELLEALRSNQEKSIQEYYCDLSFFVGTTESNQLLNSELEIIEKNIVVRTRTDWSLLKEDRNKIFSHSGIDILTERVCDIESKVEERLSIFESKSNQKNLDELRALSTSLKVENEKTKSFESRVRSEIKSLFLLEKIDSETAENLQKQLENPECSIDKLKVKFKKIFTSDFEKKVFSLLESEKRLREYSNDYIILKKKTIESGQFTIPIKFSNIVEEFKDYSNFHKREIENINDKYTSSSKLKSFLDVTRKNLESISLITKENNSINKCLRLKGKIQKTDRISVSPKQVFDTGIDIAVYGGAGAGKTTTLQMYAAETGEDKEKTTFYVPLNRLANKIRNFDRRDLSSSTLLLKIILLRIKQRTDPENVERIKEYINKQKTVLILDGLDEIFNIIPSIIHSINNFKKDFPKTQIITSSRDCVQYLSDIQFLGITLLPFTREQLRKFITGWCSDEKIKLQLIDEIESKNLYEYIRTPLLATITCTLAEKGIRLPENENQIYSQKLSLLSGRYDERKGISRQTIPEQQLIEIAHTSAFLLHQKNIRHIYLDALKKEIIRILNYKYEERFIRTALDEMIDPCNILILDTLTGTVSFGHFRFQEHLAALHLQKNRSIKISHFLESDWWRGALSLYAQDNEIEDIFENAFNDNTYPEKVELTLDIMIENSAKKKRSHLKHLKSLYVSTKSLDDTSLFHEVFDEDSDFPYINYN